jgi:hypothetical protein
MPKRFVSGRSPRHPKRSGCNKKRAAFREPEIARLEHDLNTISSGAVAD